MPQDLDAAFSSPDVKFAGFRVAPQAAIIASAAVVLAAVTFAVAPGPLGVRLALFVSSLMVGFVASYNANCAVHGACHMWAWVLAVVFAVNVFGACAMHLGAPGAGGRRGKR